MNIIYPGGSLKWNKTDNNESTSNGLIHWVLISHLKKIPFEGFYIFVIFSIIYGSFCRILLILLTINRHVFRVMAWSPPVHYWDGCWPRPEMSVFKLLIYIHFYLHVSCTPGFVRNEGSWKWWVFYGKDNKSILHNTYVISHWYTNFSQTTIAIKDGWIITSHRKRS